MMGILDLIRDWLGWDDDDDEDLPIVELVESAPLDAGAIQILEDMAAYLGVELEEVLDLDIAEIEDLTAHYQQWLEIEPVTPQVDAAESWQMDLQASDPIADAEANPNLQLAAVFGTAEEASEYVVSGNPGVLIALVDPRDGTVAVYRVIDTH